jgi:hypothetical protein
LWRNVHRTTKEKGRVRCQYNIEDLNGLCQRVLYVGHDVGSDEALAHVAIELRRLDAQEHPQGRQSKSASTSVSGKHILVEMMKVRMMVMYTHSLVTRCLSVLRRLKLRSSVWLFSGRGSSNSCHELSGLSRIFYSSGEDEIHVFETKQTYAEHRQR